MRRSLPPSKPVRAEGLQTVAIGPVDRGQDVGAVARAADGDHQVARPAVVHQLLDEDLVVAHVVAHGQNPAQVVGEAEDLEPLFRFVFQVLRAAASSCPGLR